MKNQNHKPVYAIGEAARITGATVKQLRHWHDRGYIPEPDRVVCGERSYRQFHSDDLEIISRIKEYLDQGFTIQAAAQKTKDEFKY
jgi:DNA-binding transcriptional MerR regulator